MALLSKIGRPALILLFFLPIMTFTSIYLYHKYTQTTETIHNITYEKLLETKTTLLINFIQNMQTELGEKSSAKLSESEELRLQWEKRLSVLATPEVKYLYMLKYQKDADIIKLRYLLDTTIDEDNRAYYNQKFDPESDIWKNAYMSKTKQVQQQQELDTLWTTLVIPILDDEKVIAAIGVDFSNSARTHIDNVILPLKTLYVYIIVFMIIMLIAAYIQFLLYYRTRKRSFVDTLTKIYNRQYLSELLLTINIHEYQIVMIDIDHFKKINDLFGHDIGDIVLTAVCGRISSITRSHDIFIRYGGEEFLLFLHSKDINQANEIAERISQSVKNRPISALTHVIDLTLSIGINPYPEYAKNINEAIKIADEQLFLAKSNGRDCIKVFNDKDKNQSHTTKYINDVRVALEDSRIRCMLQPIFETQTKKLKKYEMLVRLIDVDGKIVPPCDFLPAITHTKVYNEMTKYILESAKDILVNHKVELSVNLALQDLFNKDILEIILKILADNEDFAKKLTFEILETEEIEDFTALKKHIDAIKQTGAKIALDDFGSGYANFSYLLHLGIDLLKIDGSLIRDIDENINAQSIVQTINTFAQKIGIETVAEQVETKEEFNTVLELNIDYVQGYYLGKPSFELLEEE